MEVGLDAAEAIFKVHGTKYTVGRSPDVLCKLVYDQIFPLAPAVLNVVNIIPAKHVCLGLCFAVKFVPSFYRPQLRFIQRLGSLAGDPLVLHL